MDACQILATYSYSYSSVPVGRKYGRWIVDEHNEIFAYSLSIPYLSVIRELAKHAYVIRRGIR